MKRTLEKLALAPTDLSNFLSCRHLSVLDLRAARGEVTRPDRFDPVIEEVRARGLAHERAYLERQQIEVLVKSQALNRMAALGMPRSERVPVG